MNSQGFSYVTQSGAGYTSRQGKPYAESSHKLSSSHNLSSQTKSQIFSSCKQYNKQKSKLRVKSFLNSSVSNKAQNKATTEQQKKLTLRQEVKSEYTIEARKLLRTVFVATKQAFQPIYNFLVFWMCVVFGEALKFFITNIHKTALISSKFVVGIANITKQALHIPISYLTSITKGLMQALLSHSRAQQDHIQQILKLYQGKYNRQPYKEESRHSGDSCIDSGQIIKQKRIKRFVQKGGRMVLFVPRKILEVGKLSICVSLLVIVISYSFIFKAASRVVTSFKYITQNHGLILTSIRKSITALPYHLRAQARSTVYTQTGYLQKIKKYMDTRGKVSFLRSQEVMMMLQKDLKPREIMMRPQKALKQLSNSRNGGLIVQKAHRFQMKKIFFFSSVQKLSVDDAKQILLKLSAAKCEALGPTHNLKELSKVLDGEMLKKWTKVALQAQINQWYYIFEPQDIQIIELKQSSREHAVVKAYIKESCAKYTNNDKFNGQIIRAFNQAIALKYDKLNGWQVVKVSVGSSDTCREPTIERHVVEVSVGSGDTCREQIIERLAKYQQQYQIKDVQENNAIQETAERVLTLQNMQ